MSRTDLAEALRASGARSYHPVMGGTCPECGGSSREPIAPGYWQCTSVIREPAVTVVTDLATGGPRPITTVGERICRAQYQEGAMNVEAVCRCGTFAVGLCAECREPVCGIHSSMIDDRRLCDGHASAARAAIREKAEAEAAAEASAREAALARDEAVRQQRVQAARARVAALPEASFADLVEYIRTGRSGADGRQPGRDFRFAAVDARTLGKAMRQGRRKSGIHPTRLGDLSSQPSGWGIRVGAGGGGHFVTRFGTVHTVPAGPPLRVGPALSPDVMVSVEWVEAAATPFLMMETSPSPD